MSGVWIIDQAAVAGLGGSLAEIWPRLLAGESAIGPLERFATDRLTAHQAACIAGLEPGDTPNRTCALLGRCIDQMRNAECGMRNRDQLPQNTFVIWAGVKGDAEWVEDKMRNDSDSEFRIPHSAFRINYRRWAASRLGLSGAGLDVNAACASSTVGLALAAAMIERGEAESVLVCAADIVSRFTFTGFSALRALTPAVCRPLDNARDGLALGDGAAAMLLMSESAARQAGRAPLARLTGWGIANDATHITAPARDGCGLAAAIRAALERAACTPEAIGAYCVHGTGTVYNDAMELTSLEAVFGARRFPIFSVKGALGHTLGAAGALETALCIQALREKIIPPTAGLQNPEERAEGRANAGVQEMQGDKILTTNSGFGGVNAALVIEAIESRSAKKLQIFFKPQKHKIHKKELLTQRHEGTKTRKG